MTFTVFFEIYGKRMKVDVEADSESHATGIVRNKIEFHGVVLRQAQEPPKNDNPFRSEPNDIFDFLRGFGKK